MPSQETVEHSTLGKLDASAGTFRGTAAKSGFTLALCVCSMHVLDCNVPDCGTCAAWLRRKGHAV